jgi:hypothetical protein
MTARWYIARLGTTDGSLSLETVQGASVGPLSAATLLELAATGGVGADDAVWMEGTDVQITVEQFLGLARAGKVPGGEADARKVPLGPPAGSRHDDFLPEWLADTAQNESSNLLEPGPLPDWMKDVRQSEKLCTTGDVLPDDAAGIGLDWLEDIRQIEESLRLPAPPRTGSQPSPQNLSATAPIPLPSAPAPGQPLSATPEPPGYRSETGRILDPAAYVHWQKAEAHRCQDEAQQPPISVAEAFLDAQRALQDWVDSAESRPLVARGELEAIRQCRAVQELLGRYAGYGPVMREKLWKRLALLVVNRQKFIKAFCC